MMRPFASLVVCAALGAAHPAAALADEPPPADSNEPTSPTPPPSAPPATPPSAPPPAAPAPPLVAPSAAPAPETPPAEQSSEPERGEAPRPPTHFGDEGEIVLSGALSASLGHLGYDTSPNTSTSFNVEPAFDYFSDRDFSEGASAFFRYSDNSFGAGQSYWNMAYGGTVQLGLNLRLSERVSLWLKSGVGIWQSRTTYNYPSGGSVTINATPIVLGPSTEVTENALFVEVQAPFLFHLARHFFAGIGPAGYLDLINTTNGVSNKRRSLGLSSTVGGWF